MMQSISALLLTVSLFLGSHPFVSADADTNRKNHLRETIRDGARKLLTVDGTANFGRTTAKFSTDATGIGGSASDNANQVYQFETVEADEVIECVLTCSSNGGPVNLEATVDSSVASGFAGTDTIETTGTACPIAFTMKTTTTNTFFVGASGANGLSDAAITCYKNRCEALNSASSAVGSIIRNFFG